MFRCLPEVDMLLAKHALEFMLFFMQVQTFNMTSCIACK